MATVLAFGDSLTWGRDPIGGGRHAFADRWPNALAAGLRAAGAPDIEVIAEGLRGRLTAFDQTAAPADMNGARVLPVLLHSHAPLDLVVVMLGSNDNYYDHHPDRAGDGLLRLVELIRGHAYRVLPAIAPDVLLVAPPPMVVCADPYFTPERIARSHLLSKVVHSVAQQAETGFFDAASVVQSSDADGIHLDAQATCCLGKALTKPVQMLLAARAARLQNA